MWFFANWGLEYISASGVFSNRIFKTETTNVLYYLDNNLTLGNHWAKKKTKTKQRSMIPWSHYKRSKTKCF